MNEKDRADLVKYRISKARETLDEIPIHIEHELWTTIEKQEKDFWNALSDVQKYGAEIGLKQIENGETEDWENFLDRISCDKSFPDKINHDLCL